MLSKKIIPYMISIVLLVGMSLVIFIDTGDAYNPNASIGDRGGVVWDVQHRLQQIGYYPHRMDGQFGPLTRQGVQRFQSNYGLSADGVVGPQTWRVLQQVTYTRDEIQMMAQLVYGEARGEPFEGQVAVIAVVLNRLQSSQFPNFVEGVIFEPRAFTAIADGQYYMTPNAESYRAVYVAIQGWDPTDHSLYYFNPVTATSEWIWTRPQVKQIGRHIFAK